MKNRPKNLIKEITVWLVALFIFVILVNGICIFYSTSVNYADYVRWRAETVLFQIKDALTEYKSISWLVSYWQNHYREMDFSGDRAARSEEVIRLLNSCKVDSLKDIDLLLLRSFTEEEQRLYAETCYIEILPEFNIYEADFDLVYITCVSLLDDGTAFPLFQGIKEGSSNEYNYSVLGADWPFHPELHPAIGRMYEEKEEKLYFEHISSSNTDNIYLYCYLPVISDGRVLCHIGLSVTVKDMLLALVGNAVAIELINALLLFACAVCILYLIYVKALKYMLHITDCVKGYINTGDSRKAVQSLMEISSRNETKKLADDISDMIIKMERYSLDRQRRAVEEQRIETELTLARSIQMGALSSDFDIFSERTDIDLYASMTPAKTVGGDFYDFFFLDRDHLYIAIADVSGKGIPAAMVMMSTKSILANNASAGKSPSEILEASNEALFKNNGEQMFVTVWVGILDLGTGRLTAANAGHERPVIMQPGVDFCLLKDKHGLVLGGCEGFVYEEYTLDLAPGAKVFVFTDGVVEACDSNRKLFGKDRMLKALNTAKALPPRGIIEEVHGSVDSFAKGAEQFDDITMLCLEYKAKR